LVLRDLSTVQLETALTQGTVDVAFTTPLSTELAGRFHERLVNREPLLAALPSSRRMKGKRIQEASLAREPFVLFHRANSPALHDSIIRLCRECGFSPKVDETDTMQSVLSLVAAEQGISILPACALNLRSEGVRFLRLQPDHLRMELVLAWPKLSTSTVLRSFLDMVEASKNEIRHKTHFTEVISTIRSNGDIGLLPQIDSSHVASQ
jgi:DNA-binding transcriptional LysR family regulator